MTNNEIEYIESAQSYSSHDIGLTAALLSSGYEMLAMDKTDRARARFVLRRTPGIDSSINDYWGGKLSVDARTFFDTLKMLKNRLYSE